MADVKSNSFLLSSATVMMAPFGTDPFSLIPATHSLGMAREVSVTLDASEITLKNGVAQAIVDSKRTDVRSNITASIYEFTAQNMLRAVGLQTSAVQYKRLKLTANAAAAAVSLTAISAPVAGDTASDATLAAEIPAGSTILIQRVNGAEDFVFPTMTSAIATLSAGTFTIPIAGAYAIPTGMSFSIDDYVWVVTPVPIASTADADLFGIKIAGKLSNFSKPVVAVFPKVKIIKGFNLSFSETDFVSMPLELTPYLLTSTEATGRLAEIGTTRAGTVYIGG